MVWTWIRLYLPTDKALPNRKKRLYRRPPGKFFHDKRVAQFREIRFYCRWIRMLNKLAIIPSTIQLQSSENQDHVSSLALAKNAQTVHSPLQTRRTSLFSHSQGNNLAKERRGRKCSSHCQCASMSPLPPPLSPFSFLHGQGIYWSPLCATNGGGTNTQRHTAFRS
jgi:hypothetical protein